MKLNAAVRFASILSLLLVQLASAAVEVRSERFHVVTDLDNSIALRAASYLEETAARLDNLGFHLKRPELPVSVFIFEREADLVRFRGQSRARAFAATSEDRLFIVLAWNAAGSPWLALAHEYAHLATDDGQLPWFREGLADFLSLQREPGVPPISPANLITGLISKAWLPFADLLDAQDGSVAQKHELFYAQSWLTVSWLAAQQDAPISQLDPQILLNKLATEGSAAVEFQLRAHAMQLRLQPQILVPAITVRSGLSSKVLSEEDWQAWRLELFRCMFGNMLAEPSLLSFEAAHPQSPLVQAALGALAIERGRYDEAEGYLRIAAEDPHASALTHYRYALMLLRPRPDRGDRAQMAIRHAQQALRIVPRRPEFLRTLGHAFVAAGEWSQAAQILVHLLSQSEWRETAEGDFAELERSRWQRMHQTSAPISLATTQRFLPAFAYSEIAALREPHNYPWPPPDTQIMIGKIARVDCSSGEKLIIMQHPLFLIQFIELPKQPAKLHRPPLKWKTIPCGAYGWNVNIAYVPYSNRGPLKGEVRAILF